MNVGDFLIMFSRLQSGLFLVLGPIEAAHTMGFAFSSLVRTMLVDLVTRYDLFFDWEG